MPEHIPENDPSNFRIPEKNIGEARAAAFGEKPLHDLATNSSDVGAHDRDELVGAGIRRGEKMQSEYRDVVTTLHDAEYAIRHMTDEMHGLQQELKKRFPDVDPFLTLNEIEAAHIPLEAQGILRGINTIKIAGAALLEKISRLQQQEQTLAHTNE